MGNCKKCGTTLADNVFTCPICSVDHCIENTMTVDNIDQKLNSSPTLLVQDTSGEDPEEKKLEAGRLIKRGDDCFDSGKAWLGAKNRAHARKDFQRAFKYYNCVLRLDPTNDKVREARSKCLLKMA
jgi:hypothetical protein